MKFDDQMAVKLLAHSVNQLGTAITESLCTTPDRRMVRLMVERVKGDLDGFLEHYEAVETEEKTG
ncbi:MAG: hypothetical protein KJ904_14455 [Alphaproteobacteria bacterium]|nr:hypothetical protein [Alphaproteobacteria bacterium]MBU0798629.1 hypothetical protein [Alphaproteobacteria bacterium]MBU0888356.1 hypothetical protein [Alphaproteobacteria bacterium]MBU1814667.1 hypothetical protein [Alphaproteobacteria bacterium]MBU2091309.1 hypothetical protein [Alphaproteobacteria bacterium]